MRAVPIDRGILRTAALTAAAWIVYFTLKPFGWDLTGVGSRLAAGLVSTETDGWTHQVLAGLLLGFFVGSLVTTRRGHALIATLVFFTVLEIAQATVQYRHAKGVDLVLCLVGTIAGFALGPRVVARGTGQRSLWIARWLVVVGIVLPAVYTLRTAWTTRLSIWDPGFDLVLGNEPVGDRPWKGCVEGFALYDRALDEAEIEQLLAEPLEGDRGIRARKGAVSLCVFRPDGSLEDRIGPVSFAPLGPPIGLSHDGVCLPGTSGPEAGSSGLVSRSGNQELVSRLARHSEFTVELVCSSSTWNQSGPARILSFSADSDHRNFTIGQQWGDLLFQVRQEQFWDDVFAHRDTQHIFVTYFRGQALLHRSGGAAVAQHGNGEMLYLVLHPLWQAVLISLPVAGFTLIGWPTAGFLLPGVLAGLAAVSCLWAAELMAMWIVGTVFDPAPGVLAFVFLSLGCILVGALRATGSPAGLLAVREGDRVP